VVWSHWWPTHWSVHFTASSDRWYLGQLLQKKLPALLEKVPLTTRSQTCYHYDVALPDFSQVVRQYVNHRFPNRWIGRGGAQNWPPKSPDLNPLDYHVWGYLKAILYAHKVNARKELLQRILSAAKTSTTPQCFVRLQVLWSHKSEKISKQMEDISNNMSECWTASL
jgi:hypothetical protein